MTHAASHRAVATAQGAYLVQGLDRFPLGGDLDAEVTAAVTEHTRRTGRAPGAVAWDDGVLDFRPADLSFRLTAVTLPTDDPLLAAQLDGAARAAVRADLVPEGDGQTGRALAALAGTGEGARAPGLLRLVGWPGRAPVAALPPLPPGRRAGSVSAVINYRDRADVTAATLEALRRQVRSARLELILVDNQSAPAERQAVEAIVGRLFGSDPTATAVHLAFDAPFNHSAQCNLAATRASGEVLLMLSNDCVLLDEGLLQAMADRALAPGTAVVGPRLMTEDGFVSGAGMGIAERPPGSGQLHLHEAEVTYLSGLVRGSDGASFACATVARQVWERLGGADADAFPIDYNDADFCLRATRTGLASLHLGTHRARHSAGLAGQRTQAKAEAIHATLAARHDLATLPRLNPVARPVKGYPAFAKPAATRLCNFVRLYRRALELRLTGAPLAPPLRAAFERVEALAHEGGGGTLPPGFAARLEPALQAVCSAFLATEPEEAVPAGLRRAFDGLPGALAELEGDAGRPVAPIPLPAADHAERLIAAPPAAPAAPPARAADPLFASHADPLPAGAGTRLLVFADAFGPSQGILFLEALRGARARGAASVRIVTEADLQNLRSLRGADRLGPWLADTLAEVRPTAIIWSRFADADGFRAVEAAAAGLEGVPRVAHIDDDLFALPAAIGVERYREARHPRRIHALNLAAGRADMILASTPVLARRLAALFGAWRVALCPMHEGGEPAPRRVPGGPPVIGYFGSATHNRDLELVAPALRTLKAERPALRIEVVGSVARRSAAAALGDLVERRADLQPDYPAFRRAMRGWNWTVGLAPLLDHPFNAAKTPIKWTEYAAAGIPVVASRVEPYLDLGRQGALLLASPGEWHGRVAALLDGEARRAALLDASDRLLAGFDGWGRMERRLLGLLDRAAARRQALLPAA